MKIAFKESELPRHCVGRGNEFGAAVLAVAVRNGETLEIDSADWHRLSWEHANKAKGISELTEPTTLELAANFTGAMARWAAAGFATVSGEQYAARAEVCDACEHWDGAARMGLGKCKAPGCGCTSFKRWLSSERCSLGKWPVS